jgi:VWFA-related protein
MSLSTILCSRVLGLPVLASMLLLGAGAAVAQQPSSTMPAAPSSPAALHERTGPASRTINLDVMVTDKHGKPVTGLQQKDFALLDDKLPQSITAFHAYAGQEAPVQVILLIDDVNTSYTVISQERIQIDKFLRSNGGALAEPVTLGVFTDKGVQLQGGYSKDGNLQAAALDKFTIGLRELGRSGGIEGANQRFQESLDAMKTLATYTATRPGRKIILWVSPGWPLLTGPQIQLTEKQEQWIFDTATMFSAQLRDSQTTLYSVNPLGTNESVGSVFYYQQYVEGLKKPTQANMANLALQVFATQTGGLVVNSNDISGLLEQCVDEVGAYYRISFEPPAAEHKDVYHAIKVTVGQPDLTARTTTGYYAEP